MASNSRSEAGTERRREHGWLRVGEGRPAALALALMLGLLFALLDLRPERALRNALFDAYQQFFPRPQGEIGVVVIGIDDRSLSEIGQWPWPRTELARLVARVDRAQPAAIGLDMIFAEPDRHADDPRRSKQAQPLAFESDREFARVLGRSGLVVLGLSGLDSEDQLPGGITYRPPIVQDQAEIALDALVPRFSGVLHNLDVIESSVSGHGAINRIEEDDSVVRRLPTLLNVAGQVLPSLPLELLRVVSGDPVLRVRLDAGGLRSVQAGDWIIPTDRGGQWWVHYSRESDFPVASAVDVINGRIAAATLRGRIVLIGAMSSGIGDRIVTPLGDRSGVIAHAEALQGVLHDRVPHRPGWSPWLELGVLVATALVAILVVPLFSALNAILAFALVAGLCLVAGVIAFVELTWLLDVANPLVAATVVLTAMLLMSLGRAERQRESLRLALDDSREREARLEGELDAARRIQSGMLPDPMTVVGADARLDMAALMQPARTVGGDMYDFFRLDDRHLFFMVGDVSGKGLPASLFMALSKTLIKGAALNVGVDPALGLTAAARVIARENPEAMFVSVAACTLDLDSGELAWCCAGHEAPFRVRASDRHATRLDSRGGPPLCMVENFEYPSERIRLTPGDLICLVTDGVTEARNPADALYGATRFEIALGIAAAESSSHRIIEYLRRDVERFVGGEEFSDDLTLLALRWWGPAGRR